MVHLTKNLSKESCVYNVIDIDRKLYMLEQENVA